MSVELERAQRLERFLAQDPSNIVLLRDIATTYQATGLHDQAQPYFERLRELVGDEPTLLNNLGAIYLSSGLYDKAIQVLSLALKQNPEAAPILFNLGYTEFSRGNSDDASRLFQQALDKDPQNTEYLYFLALAQDELGEHEASEQTLKTLFSIKADHVKGNLFKALNELQAGQLDSARKRAGRILKQNPKALEALQLKAEIAILEFNAQKSLSYLRQAESIDTDNCQTQVLLGQSLLILQRIKQARQAFEKALAAEETAFPALIGLGWAALFQADVEQAEQTFKHALDMAPEEADAHSGLAMVRLAQENFSQAARHVESALKLDPTHIAAQFAQSVIAEKQGDTATSHATLQTLLQEQQINPFGWNAGQISAQLGDSQSGKRVFNKYRRYMRMKSNNGQ
jgi:Tfp pilus assembly protein PilF